MRQFQAGDLVICPKGLFFVEESSRTVNNIAQSFKYHDLSSGPFIFLYSKKTSLFIEFMFFIDGCIMSHHVSIANVDEFYKRFEVIASI